MTRGSETKERILVAARKAFADRGYTGATIGMIARAAGLTEGAIYRHFADKKELFLSCVAPVVDLGFQRTLAELRAADTLREAFRAMVKVRLEILADNQDTFDILFTEVTHHEELRQIFIERIVLARLDTLMPELARFSEGRFSIKRINPLMLGLGLTIAIWAIFKVRGSAEAVRAKLPIGDTDDLLDELTDFVLYGVAGEPAVGGKV